jgi:hypothetical protein
MPRRDHNRQDLSELKVGGILSTVLPRAIRFCCRKNFQRSRNDRNLLAAIVAAAVLQVYLLSGHLFRRANCFSKNDKRNRRQDAWFRQGL